MVCLFEICEWIEIAKKNPIAKEYLSHNIVNVILSLAQSIFFKGQAVKH